MISCNKLVSKKLAGSFCFIVLSAYGSTVLIAGQNNGEAEFKENCAECHVEGGNIVNSNKTLSEKDRNINGIKTVKDIVLLMRNPGEGMTRFDEKTISEGDAEKIAEYIITTFK